MHIIQLTDLHLSVANDRPYDIDVRSNFLSALKSIQLIDPDLLVISGDLCYASGMTEIYEWIKEQLEKLTCPYYLIPGNHDDTQMMINCFGLESYAQNGQLFYKSENSPQPILFLDTADYTLPDHQIEWLKTQLKELKGALTIFMHHPPAVMGVPYMDQNHPLKNRDAVLDILLSYPAPITIFTGHYHVDKSIRKQNLDIHITPSTFFQIDWTKKDFQVDHKRCGFRSIQLTEDEIIHSVVYFD